MVGTCATFAIVRRSFATGPQTFLAIEPTAALQEYDEGQDTTQEQQQQIAIVCIEGPIEQRAGWFGPGYDSIRACFEAALASEAAAVVLKINSPGGAAAGNIECARAMIEAKKASGKPVWAYSDEAAYSAAYALACVADRIFLPDTGGVGSIGCLCVAADMTEMVKKAGIKAVVVRSGKRKAEGHPMLPLDAETLASFQSRVDDLAQIFAEFVAGSRGVSPKRLLSLEGACFYGQDAVSKRLADGVMSFDAMLGKLAAQLGTLDGMAQGVPSLGSLASVQKAKGVSPMTLEQLKAALAVAQAAGDSAKVASIQAQINALLGRSAEDSEEESEDEGSEEESDDGGDDEGDDEDEPTEEEEETKRTTTTKTYRKSKKNQAAVASVVEEVFPGLSAAQVRGKLMALRDGQSSSKKLEAKVKTLETENRRGEVNKLVARGVRQGKISPAQKDFWVKQGMRADGLEALKEYLLTASPVVSTEALTPSLETPMTPGGLTVLESTICMRMGVTPEQFSKQKAAGTTIVLTRVAQ